MNVVLPLTEADVIEAVMERLARVAHGHAVTVTLDPAAKDVDWPTKPISPVVGTIRLSKPDPKGNQP